MSTFPFAPAREGDQPRVIATLVSAFIDDPVERWLFPEPHQYLTHFPRFVAAFGGAAFVRGTVWMLDGFGPQPCGFRRAPSPTQTRSSSSSPIVSRPSDTRTHLRCWNRWTERIRPPRIGICHDWALTLRVREPDSVVNC